MSTEQKAKKTAIVVAVWIGIIAVLGLAYKFVYVPWSEGKSVIETGTDSQYKHEVRLHLDSFSGYAPLRSETMRNLLKKSEIRLNVTDDKADYVARLKALKDGDADMAVFTVDSFLKAGAELGEFPASIVAVIDETKGGDAVIAYRNVVPNIQALDSADSKFVLTPNSPSEFLGRVVIAQFSLPNLSNDWIEKKDGAEEVYKEFVRSKGKRNAYVLWEPYVTKALKEPEAQVLLDSSKLSGYIVDVLVARRGFLKEKPALATLFVEAYFRASHSYGSRPDGMTELVKAEANLSQEEAANTVKGIQWKNTLENYAYFRIQQAPGVENLEDVIERIADVLVKTGAMRKNPVAGQASTLFYNGILAELHSQGFHPGRTGNTVIQGVGPGADELAAARGVQALPELTVEQWSKLQAVGNAKIAPLSFMRGSERLTVGSEQDLDDLAKRLQGAPSFYLRIVGHSRAEGDPEANKRLAKARAQSAYDRLVASGISPTRLRAEAATSSGNGGEAQSVSFILGNVPY